MRPSSSQDIVAGDIMSKRSLWEQKGNPKPETNVKVSWYLYEYESMCSTVKKKRALGWVVKVLRRCSVGTRAACIYQCNRIPRSSF